MNKFNINQELCSHCGSCVEVCPALLLERDENKIVNFKQDFLDICLGCGQCMAVCVTEAIVANGMTYEKDFFPINKEEDFFSMIERRRSVRRFKPKPLTKEEIDKLIHAISMAPHGDSKQNVEITVINNRKKIMDSLPAIIEFYDKIPKMIRNPMIRYFIKKEVGIATLNTLKNHLAPRIEKGIYREVSETYDGIARGAHTVFLFHAAKNSEEHFEDSYVFVTYGILAAQAMGLGATVIGLFGPAINKTPALKEMFQIPKENEVIVSMIVGHPKYKYRKGIKREVKSVRVIE